MRKILILLTFTLLALLLIHPLVNNDIWMHLRTGQIMIEDMRVSSIDTYSYTREGKDWLNHQWLSQVIFYLFYRSFGVNGIILLQAIVVFGAFLLLFKNVYVKNRCFLSVFLIILVILFSQEKFLVRPLVFSLFLFSAFAFILYRFKYSGSIKQEKLIYVLIPLQILWVNLHAASIMGVFLIWAYIFGEVIDSSIRKALKDEFVIRGEKYRKLLYTGIILTIATGLTPYGYNAILFPIRELKGMYFIVEWLPSIYEDTFLNFGIMPYYRLFLFISIFVFILRVRFISSSHIIIFSALLYLSLSSNRHLCFYGFAVAPLVTRYLRGIEFKKVPLTLKKIFVEMMSVILVLYLVILNIDVFTGKHYVKMNNGLRFGLGKIGYPDEAVDFLKRTGLKGNMFNDYGSGCYLIWRLYPETKVFLDGRNTIYGIEFIKQNYIDRLLDPLLFEQLVVEYDINLIFLQYALSLENLTVIIPYLYNSKNWELVFFDDKACVFAKNIDSNYDIINKYSINLKETMAAFDMKKQKGIITYPHEYINKALFCEQIGLVDLGIKLLNDGILAGYDTGDLYYNLGTLYLKKGMYKEAVSKFKKTITCNRNDVDAYHNLGVTYARTGKYKNAIEEFRKVLRLRPFNKLARSNLKQALRDYEEKNQ